MGKYKPADPARYAIVQCEQDHMKVIFEGKPKVTVLCPYCKRRVTELFKGEHDGNRMKCAKCATEFICPPLVFSRLNN